MRQFGLAAMNPDDLKKVVDAFDQWKKTRTFKDHEMAAKLHMAAAFILWRVNLRPEAAKKCKEGLAFQPHDPLRAVLARAVRAATSAANLDNHALARQFRDGLLRRPGQLRAHQPPRHPRRKGDQAHLNGDQERYPAKLIAGNEAGDMALLKLELPDGKHLKPIPLAGNGAKIGEDVYVMGWPGVISENSTLTLTKGVVSTLPGPNDEKRMIATDCKVNQGNSGGPLGSFGGIVGMVSAKTTQGESYGIAIPVERLRKFLLEKLPPDAQELPPPPASATNLKLSDQAESFAPSVVFVENLQFQAMGVPGPGQQ